MSKEINPVAVARKIVAFIDNDGLQRRMVYDIAYGIYPEWTFRGYVNRRLDDPCFRRAVGINKNEADRASRRYIHEYLNTHYQPKWP